MSKAFRRIGNDTLRLFNVHTPSRVLFHENEDTLYEYNDGTLLHPSCINCIPQLCRRINIEEIQCDSFQEMSPDMLLDVCPVDAISAGSDSIAINQSSCIGCGLCVARCPIGALSIKNGKATLNDEPSIDIEIKKTNADNISRQSELINSFRAVSRTGIIREESNSVLKSINDSIRSLSQEQQNIFARNILIVLGNHATISRHGNVYLRLDGFYENKDMHGVLEIETGQDMLEVSRAVLDDIATLNVRYDISKENNTPVAICLELPNKRTDYWQVVQDIDRIINIRINTVTFSALLILLWNHATAQDFSKFHIDIDDPSIRGVIEEALGRSVNITEGYGGALENAK